MADGVNLVPDLPTDGYTPTSAVISFSVQTPDQSDTYDGSYVVSVALNGSQHHPQQVVDAVVNSVSEALVTAWAPTAVHIAVNTVYAGGITVVNQD